MTKYNTILACLFLLMIVGCQTHDQKAYSDLLKQGTTLVGQDTISAKVGEKLLYLYSFSAGVQPIYYTLEHLNSDSTSLKYIENLQYYVGEEDMSGGPSEGVHVFEAQKAGLVRLEFYNPYYNEMKYKEAHPDYFSSDRAIMEFYKTFADSVAMASWTEAQYNNYYNNWMKEADADGGVGIDTLLQRFELAATSIDSVQKQKVIQRLAERYAMVESSMAMAILDTLFDLPNIQAMEAWHAALKERRENLPLHKNLETVVCYVEIKA